MKRKPIQICSTSDKIIIICDDGTIWSEYNSRRNEQIQWERLPDIPQDKIDNETEGGCLV